MVRDTTCGGAHGCLALYMGINKEAVMKNTNLKVMQEQICGKSVDVQAIASFGFGGFPSNALSMKFKTSGIANKTKLKAQPSIANFTSIRI